jgi:serine/threonine protein kinase
MRLMTGQSDDDLIGQRVGKNDRIVVTRMIGQGGSGTIYMGWDEKYQRYVALKFLHKNYAENSTLLARFMREGRKFGKLEHPNLVRVWGWGQKAGRLFIITEYVDGVNLYELLQMHGYLPLDRALTVCRGVAAGLSEAHRQDIVHRDLKPENIMVRNQDGAVKVLDFGIAKDLNSSLDLTGLGMYIGTPAYSAPEQVRGDQVDHRADIFSLGVILYELLTGKVAFDGRHSTEVLRATLKHQPRPVTDFNDLVTRPVANLIDSMIAKDRKERIQTMEEVILELDELLGAVDDVVEMDDETIRSSLKDLFE